ncbi:MAG: VWA domain-containing protein [Spirochaetales bacterium]|nr:VWA domain-containing protein [Spirochaetales bacterium]
MNASRLKGPGAAALGFLILLLSGAAAFGDGFIVIPRPDHPVSLPGGAFPLEVRYHHVTVDIKDRTALTSIDQVFYNPGGRALEGEYIFPVPKGAVIEKFSMYIDGREMKAELLDAAKARTIYEDIVRQIRDPALLEYRGSNLFHVRIFPIEPKKEKRVKISYSEILAKDGPLVEYVYPLNTEKFSAAPLESVSIKVSIESREKIKNVFSTTHSVDTTYLGDRQAVVGWEAGNVKPDADFKLYYAAENTEFGVSLLSHRVKGEDGYFFLDLSPGFWEKGREKVPKDVVFVLDVSGSMAGDKLAQAKAALRRCLERLDSRDRFSIVRFSTEAESLFDALVPADASRLAQARDFVDRLLAVGGTNIEDALARALALGAAAGGGQNRARIVVLITDGKPTIGETDSSRLVADVVKGNAGNMRIFTVGIDDTLDTILLDKLTIATRAFRTYVSPREDMAAKLDSFWQKLDAPVLANIRLRVTGGVTLFAVEPKLTELPDLFLGSSLTLLGRYRGSGRATITVQGTAGGRAAELSHQLDFPAQEAGDDNIAPLWAARRVGFLLEEMRLHGETKELVDEVIYLARTYGIITPYTSYLVIEDEARRVSGNRLNARDQTLRNVAPQPAFEEKSKREFESLKDTSGASGNAASGEVQSLRQAQSNDASKTSAPRLTFTDEGGRTTDVQTRIKQVNGRAFYNSGREWNDADIQNQKAKKTNRVQFASTEYWNLLKNKPETARYLALGTNVRFMLDGELYEIYE